MTIKYSRLPQVIPFRVRKKSFSDLPVREWLRRHWRKLILPVIGMGLFVMIAIPVATYLYFVRDLANKETIMNRNNTGVVLLDRHGKPFYSFNEARQKQFVPLKEISAEIQKALVAAEDKGFYSHSGFSLRAILAAFWADIRRQDLSYGGSTITQQLVKNSLLSHDKTFLRKYQELVLAMEIERRFSKEEILEMYLNSVYFGEGAYGIGSATETYFGKKPKEINLAEGALLAGLPKAPSTLSPISGDRNKALERMSYVLGEMVEESIITPEQKDEALKTTLNFKDNAPTKNFSATHFALMVQNQLEEEFGEERVSRSGFQVHTTLDLDWQRYAEEQVNSQVKKLATSQVSNGAAVVRDVKTGEIRAMVGSYDWTDDRFGKVNMTTTPRQPGSSFKPIVYADGFSRKIITPGSILQDNPKTYNLGNGQNYRPVNYDGTFRGEVLVRRALANSLNLPALDVMEKVGVSSAINMAAKLGITTLNDPDSYGLSLVLGSGEVSLLEMTSAYATFANNGTRLKSLLIVRIQDKQGKEIFKSNVASENVLDPSVAFLISDILADNQARQEEFGNALTISRPAAVKTGTTNDYKDSWTIGYTPSLAIGVWVGNNDNRPMNRVAGSLGAAPIWRNLMERFHQGAPVERFTPPANVNQQTICRSNGLLVRENTSTSSAYREYFIRGTEPKRECVIVTPTPTPTETPSPTPETPSPTVPEPSQVLPLEVNDSFPIRGRGKNNQDE